MDAALKYGRQHGGLGIQILYPGLVVPQLNDTSNALKTSDVVLLMTQTNAAHFDGGMYSGNLR